VHRDGEVKRGDEPPDGGWVNRASGRDTPFRGKRERALRSKERELREREVGPDAAGARQIRRVADCGFAVHHPQHAWKDGMGIAAWKDDMETGVETLDGRDVGARLDAIERRTLRALISTAVRDREVLDAKAWKEIKANGRPAAPQ
jgi:hypothetical protein